MNAGPPAGVPAVVSEVLRSPGRPLEPVTRRFMESRFGTDFSRVRVHTDARAAESAHLLDARAYAVGRHIVFAAGSFDPATARGRGLLAHELAHVVQQAFQDPPATTELAVAPPADRYEREAQAVAAQIAAGGPPTSVHASGTDPRVQKHSEEEERADRSASQFPDCVCGPNVTDQVEDVLSSVVETFLVKWSDDWKEDSCSALTSLSTAINAWDIVELHLHDWLPDYQPPCATVCWTEDQSCESTVQINNTCHYAGSVNYVLYGVMNKLCNTYWSELIRKEFPHIPQRAEVLGGGFTEDEMVQYIWLYKGSHPHPGRAGLGVITGLFDWKAAGNYEQSKAWARAGYNAWPLDQPKPPPGDRPLCSPTCPLAYGSVSNPKSAKGPFHWHWLPHQDLES